MKPALIVACIVACIVVTLGCSEPRRFRNIGVGRDNVLAPAESIDDYAAGHGMTHEQAVQAMQREAQERRIAEHAAKYGISESEAEAQLLFADSHNE